MKFIVRNAGNRSIEHLKVAIPELLVVRNNENAMSAFVEALEMAGDDAVRHLEDDIELCNDFYNKVVKIINAHPDDVIQFF